MEKSERTFLKVRRDAANREHQAHANDHPFRSDTEEYDVATGIEHEHEPEGFSSPVPSDAT